MLPKWPKCQDKALARLRNLEAATDAIKIYWEDTFKQKYRPCLSQTS